MVCNVFISHAQSFRVWPNSPEAVQAGQIRQYNQPGGFWCVPTGASIQVRECGDNGIRPANPLAAAQWGWRLDIPDGSQSLWEAKFSGIGWNFITAGFGSPIFDCDPEVHPVYVYNGTYDAYLDYSSFSLTGTSCGSPYTNVVMTTTQDLYKYKLDITEVNSSNVPVAGGWAYSSGWKKNFEPYFRPCNPCVPGSCTTPQYDRTFRFISGPAQNNNDITVNFQQGKRYLVTLSTKRPSDEALQVTQRAIDIDCRPLVAASLQLPTNSNMQTACASSKNIPLTVEVNSFIDKAPKKVTVSLQEQMYAYCSGVGRGTAVFAELALVSGQTVNLYNYLALRAELERWPAGQTYKDYKVKVTAENSIGTRPAVEKCFRLYKSGIDFQLIRSPELEDLMGVTPRTGVANRSETFSAPVEVGANSVGIDFDQLVLNASNVSSFKVELFIGFLYNGSMLEFPVWDSGNQPVINGSLPSVYMLNNIPTGGTAGNMPMFLWFYQNGYKDFTWRVKLTVQYPCGTDSKFSYFKLSSRCMWCNEIPNNGDQAESAPDLQNRSNKSAVIQEAKSLVLYPNPVKEQLYIGGLDKIKGSISMRVFDALGRTVIEPTVVDDKGLNVVSLPSGTYFYQLGTDDTTVLSGSFIKE